MLKDSCCRSAATVVGLRPYPADYYVKVRPTVRHLPQHHMPRVSSSRPPPHRLVHPKHSVTLAVTDPDTHPASSFHWMTGVCRCPLSEGTPKPARAPAMFTHPSAGLWE